MKKLILIIAMLMQFAVLFGQNMDYQRINTDRHDFKKPDFRSTKTVPVWEVTFEEDVPVWTFGSITGTKTWYVGDTTPTNGFTYSGVPAPPMWIYMGHRYVKDFSASGNNFAYVDGISDLLGLFPMQVSETFIQFDNIDLSTSEHPKLIFYQNYKTLNIAYSYVDFSEDGGVTWVSINVNSLYGNTYGDNYCEFIPPVDLAGNPNVSIRFRWETTGNTMSEYAYGWEIDDVAFVENPDYDYRLVDARMNFFQYIDYTEPGNSQYFHYSSHYGKIPRNQFTSDLALSWFNVIVQNRGNITIDPVVNVKVFDPSMNEIFNYTSTTDITEPLGVFEIDTVDMVDMDFSPGTDPETGLYTVIYSVDIEGQTDDNTNDNSVTAYFEITDTEFSRCLNGTSGKASPGNYIAGGQDGEMIGTCFTFLVEDEINSIDVFIAENSTTGMNFVAHILVWNEDASDYVELAESELLTISQSDIGTWKNITFMDPVQIAIPEGGSSVDVMVAMEYFYNSEYDDLYIGYDTEIHSSPYSTYWYFVDSGSSNANEWIVISAFKGALCIKINPEEEGLSCPEDVSVCINQSALNLSSLVNIAGNFSGQGVEDNMFYADIAGVGEQVILYTTLESQCSFTITVSGTPVQKEIALTPANGMLSSGQTGVVDIIDSDIGITYWVSLNGNTVTEELSGGGSILTLGDSFAEGTYQIWSSSIGGCLVQQANFTFVEDEGISKIVAFAGYGDPQLLFCSGESTISLYREYLNSEEELITELVAEQIVGSSGNVVFEGLEPGNYYISSVLNNNQNDSIAENAFYDNALIFDDATLFSLEDAEIKIINLNHQIIEIVEGTNTGGGTVGDQEEGKSLNPLEGKVVALRNADDDEIIAISVTDENGNYEFEAIPDNTNINIFVTMPESPVWTAYNVLTGVGETISVDFIVSGSSVFPATSLLEQEENVLETIIVSPNPCTDKLNLGTDSNWDQIKIFNCTGELIINIGGTGINSVEVSSLSAGQYIIVGVNQDSAVGINKFVKY